MNELLTKDSISLTVTVLSFAFAVLQIFQNRKTKKIIALEAIELHHNVAGALGATQAAKEAIINGQSPSSELGRAEGLCQAVLHESAKLYCNLENTRTDDIDDLILESRLKEHYRSIYLSYSGQKRGFLRLAIKRLSKII